MQLLGITAGESPSWRYVLNLELKNLFIYVLMARLDLERTKNGSILPFLGFCPPTTTTFLLPITFQKS
jgi:hypothetical protein